jgi:hypothetical protein
MPLHSNQVYHGNMSENEGTRKHPSRYRSYFAGYFAGYLFGHEPTAVQKFKFIIQFNMHFLVRANIIILGFFK